MRLFVAVDLPATLKRAAFLAGEALRRNVQRIAPDIKATWVSESNLHLTLWFLGEVNDATAEAFSRSMQRPFRTTAFALHLRDAGAFPSSGPLRVIWFGVHAGGQEMRALHDELRERLTPLGFEAEKRVYAAHLTIARVREMRNRDARAVRRILEGARIELQPARVGELTVFRSRLSPRGSQYEPLLRVPLS